MATGEPSTSKRTGAGRPRKAAVGGDADPRLGIVAAASRLFAHRGVAATTMAEIADAAGLGASSIYYWFKSKQQILEVIVADANRAPLHFAEAVADEPGSPAARLWRLVHFDVVTLCEFPFDINEIHRMAGESPSDFARYWDERQRLNDIVERLLQAGVDAGELSLVDSRLAALTLLANDEAVQNWYRPVGGQRLSSGDYRADEIASFIADLALRGLLADASRLEAVRAQAQELGK